MKETKGVSTQNTILNSVGERGSNSHQDVFVIQTLLKSKGFDPGRADGICGPRTVLAIRNFQRTFLAQADGLVEPGRTTWLRLSSPSGSSITALNQWSGDSAQWSQDKKIASLNPTLRPKVQVVLSALVTRGF
jgi:peptidoglycan hydrolase-like protein with peptidoglycan-binding domain